VKIAIDYTTGIYPGAGVARYTRSLVAAIAALDPDNVYRLVYAARGLPRHTPEARQAAALFASHPNLRPTPVPMSVRQMFAVWHRLRLPLPLELFVGRCDVVHSPDFVCPPHLWGGSIITVHDLSFLVVPECAHPALAAFLGRAVPAAVRRARRIIAVSEQTRRDLIGLLSVPPHKIVVAHNGVDPCFRPLPPGPQMEALRAELDLPTRFVLHVGTLEPRKNLVRLIEAYRLLVSHRPHLRTVGLVLAGRKGWRYQPILEAAERAGSAGGRVLLLDYVLEENLPLLYNMAEVFAYPSLYEGFGLPAAEALACGVPALVSAGGALAEVVGDAALAVDPRSVHNIASGLERLLEDDELRARLSAAGPRQVARFTWQTAARTVLATYRDVAQGMGAAGAGSRQVDRVREVRSEK
jgi:glycosyltransferase involved in cell wall biosynthesis